MGVSNVNNINIVKLALGKQKAKASQQMKPEYLTMTGSIFKAPNPTLPTTRETLATMNTRRSVAELHPNPVKSASGKEEPFNGVNDLSGGRAAMGEVKAMKGKTQSYTKQTQSDEKTAARYSDEGRRTAGNIEKGQKAFTAGIKAKEKAIEDDNKKMLKVIRETEQVNSEIDNMQHELEAYKSAGNSDKANSLQQAIGSKVGKLQQNGKMIYSLQRSSSRNYTSLRRYNANFMRVQNHNKESLEKTQTKTEKIIDKAAKIEQYSAMAQAGGQALGLLGDVFIALGEAAISSIFGSGAGAAFVTLGTAMKHVGSVVELVGSYGQTAAGITKTVAYAADGNLMGAMMSATTALQSGAAAVKNTQQLGNNMKNISAQGRLAKQNIEAKEQAKDIVKDMAKNKELDGMSKKEARKYIQADLRQQMADATDDGNMKHMKMKDYKNLAKEKSGQAKENAIEAWETAKNTVISDNNLIKENGKLKKDGNKYVSSDLDKKGKNEKLSERKFNKQVNKSFKNERKELQRSTANFGEQLTKMGGTLTSVAALWAQNKAADSMSPKKKPISPGYMDARTQRIMQRNQRYRAYANYV